MIDYTFKKSFYSIFPLARSDVSLSELSSHCIFLSCGTYSFITLIIGLCVHILSCPFFEIVKQFLESRKYGLYLMCFCKALHVVGV